MRSLKIKSTRIVSVKFILHNIQNICSLKAFFFRSCWCLFRQKKTEGWWWLWEWKGAFHFISNNNHKRKSLSILGDLTANLQKHLLYHFTRWLLYNLHEAKFFPSQIELSKWHNHYTFTITKWSVWDFYDVDYFLESVEVINFFQCSDRKVVSFSPIPK